jgi:hypothetical protein
VPHQLSKSLKWIAAASAALALAAPSVAPASDAPKGHTDCFASVNWLGWKSPSPNVVYLRVNVNDIYQLDLSAGSNELQAPDVHLVDKLRGSDWICSPLDMQLWVVDELGAFRAPLIVKSITRLTPEQVAAIPPKFRP